MQTSFTILINVCTKYYSLSKTILGRLGSNSQKALIEIFRYFLKDILQFYLESKEMKCLELFARNLIPGWTSWGNEVREYVDYYFVFFLLNRSYSFNFYHRLYLSLKSKFNS